MATSRQEDFADLSKQATAVGYELWVPDLGASTSDAVVHKYLVKYSKLLISKNCICIQTIQPSATVFAMTDGPRQKYAVRLLDFLSNSGICSGRRLIFYAFSNGGCTVYERISFLFEQGRYEELQGQTAGLIFDSCPAYLYVNKGSRALTHGLPILQTVLLRTLFYILAYASYLFVGNIPARYWSTMSSANLGVPELYLYSKDDDLTTFDDLDKLVDYRKSRGIAVTKQVWERSKHVTHVREHPEAYTAALYIFLDTISSPKG